MTPDEQSQVEETYGPSTNESAPSDSWTPPAESVTQPQQEQEVVEEEQPAVAPDEPEVSEVTEDTPVASEPEPSSDEEEEDYPQVNELPQMQQVDINQFVDAQGNLDLQSFQAAQAAAISQNMQIAAQQAIQQARLERAYEKDWDKAFSKFPELKNNRELRDMVQAIHANSAVAGKRYLSPTKAAEKFFGFAGQAKQEGIKAATERRTVQAAAQLGAPNPPSRVQGDRIQGLKNQMHNGATLQARQDANKSLIEEMVTRGIL